MWIYTVDNFLIVIGMSQQVVDLSIYQTRSRKAEAIADAIAAAREIEPVAEPKPVAVPAAKREGVHEDWMKRNGLPMSNQSDAQPAATGSPTAHGEHIGDTFTELKIVATYKECGGDGRNFNRWLARVNQPWRSETGLAGLTSEQKADCLAYLTAQAAKLKKKA